MKSNPNSRTTRITPIAILGFALLMTTSACELYLGGGGDGDVGDAGNDTASTGGNIPDATGGTADTGSSTNGPSTNGSGGVCGNGTIETGEQCEEGVWGGQCNDLQDCVNCQCSNLCGNNWVDPGEQCDPPGASCGDGFSCTQNCDCVRAECGDGVCDRPAGESETTCSQDCPATCGDGICNATAGEDVSCPEDCPNTQVDCCVQNNGCPSEGLYTCEGSDCCCCPYGARCVQATGLWVCGI